MCVLILLPDSRCPCPFQIQYKMSFPYEQRLPYLYPLSSPHSLAQKRRCLVLVIGSFDATPANTLPVPILFLSSG